MSFTIINQIATVFLTGLVAGLLYGYSCSVNKALGNLSDEKYLEAFQSINRVIQNPVFFSTFIGSLVLLALSSYLLSRNGTTLSFYFLLLATIVYSVGVFGVTVLKNVPLNEQLDKFNIGAAATNEISKMRTLFETPWNTYHTIRMIASIVTFLLSILSLIKLK